MIGDQGVGCSQIDSDYASFRHAILSVSTPDSQVSRFTSRTRLLKVAPPIEQGHHRLLCDCLARTGVVAVVPHLPLRAQVAIDVIQQPSNFSLPAQQLLLATAGSSSPILRAMRISSSCMFRSKTSSSRSAGTRDGSFCDLLAAVLFANLRAVQLEQILGAVHRILQRAIGVVEQRRVGQAPLLLVFAGAGKAIGMQLAAEAMELVLQRREIEIQLAAPVRRRKNNRRPEAAESCCNAGRTSVASLCATAHDQHATGTAESRTFNMIELQMRQTYDENDEPQPQEREEFGLMKLKPCRISVSS